MRECWRRYAAWAGATIALAALSGCGSGTTMMQLAPVAGYTSSNMMMPEGYSERVISETHYAVRGTGSLNTPRSRVEKLAITRAAEIGVEQKFKYFKVVSVAHSVSCKKEFKNARGDRVPEAKRPLVDIEVAYAKDTKDPTYRNASDTFKALSAELESEVVPDDAKSQAAAEVESQCGT